MTKDKLFGRLFIFSVMNFFALGTKITGISISSTLFLKQFGPHNLPYIFLISALTLVILSRLIIKLSKKYPLEDLFFGFTMIMSFSILVFWGWMVFELPYANSIGIFALSIFSEMATFIVTSLLWNLTSR